jgi:hypothetical protein
MPYTIRKINSGYKVCKKNSSKCFSKKPFPTKEKAVKQLAAIQIATKNEKRLIDLISQIFNE